MEKAIEDLKKQYLETALPVSEQEGLSDLFERIENVKKVPFYFSKMFLTLTIILVVISAFSGMVLASTPTSPLYPVKKATYQVVTNLTNPEIDTKMKIEKILTPKKSQPKPTSTITPTPNKADTEKENKSDKNELNENNSQPKSEVKGINTVSPTYGQQKNSNNENKKSETGKVQKSENSSSERRDNSQENSSSHVPQTPNQGKGNNK